MQKFESYLKIFFYIIVVFLIAGFIILFLRTQELFSLLSTLPKGPLENAQTQEEKETEEIGKCSDNCKEEIQKIVSDAVSSVSGTTKTVVQKTQTVMENKVAYVPLSGPITTTSTGWVDAAGTDIYIDLVGDYGKNAKVSWEAFLKVAHGNGQAYARLYDVTHGIAVDGSELTLVNKDTSTQVSSGNLSFWSGRNLYRVQIKSLNSFEVTFGSGRIKISY